MHLAFNQLTKVNQVTHKIRTLKWISCNSSTIILYVKMLLINYSKSQIEKWV